MRRQAQSLPSDELSGAHGTDEDADRRAEVMTLSPRDSRAFVEAILAPSEPNEALRRAAQRYREFFGE